MLSGSRRKRGGDEYVFIDGKAMTADEAVRVQLADSDTAAVPGQDQAAAIPGGPVEERRPRKMARSREALRQMDGSDAFELREDALQGGPFQAAQLHAEDKRSMRMKYLVAGGVLALVALFSLCLSAGYYGVVYSPLDVLACYVSAAQVWFTSLNAPATATQMLYDVYSSYPMYFDVLAQALQVLKYGVCGLLLALSGMLYQNAFRNPIAAPSMLGVTSGINIAILVLVLLFSVSATYYIGYYYLFAYLGGAVILVLVMLGGKWVSGKDRFNVVNMLLFGTIVSQLAGVVTSYVQANFLTEGEVIALYNLQNAVNIDSIFTFASLLLGTLAAVIPVIVFRFRLNLVSFSDGETRLLGVDPNKLRILAIGCGSLMILTAQVNAGQVAMASLVIPFLVRAAFGSEFRKQLWGNILCGAILLLLCEDVSRLVYLGDFGLTVGSIVSVVALPLFVWMIAVQQRSWE